MANDKRRAPRVPAPALIHVCYLENDEQTTGDGDIRDISVTGLRFLSDQLLLRGADLLLKIHFPRVFQRLPLTVHATVVRCWTPAGEPMRHVACTYKKLDAAASAKIKEFTDWLAKQPGVTP